MTLSGPLLAIAPPLPLGAELPVKVTLLTARFPSLMIAPPSPLASFPFWMVRFLRLRLPVVLTFNTWNDVAPSTAMGCPLPSMVTSGLVMVGSSLPKVMVPLTLNTTSLPSVQSPPVVSVSLLALLIASRRLHLPSPEVLLSRMVLTSIGRNEYSYAPTSQASGEPASSGRGKPR